MRYMLLIGIDRSAEAAGAAPGEMSAPFAAYAEWLQQQGLLRGGERLDTTASATTVRVRDGKRFVTDGPFAETKEVLGGYFILECEDLDRALDAAVRCPAAAYGSVEVRPIVDMPRPAAVGVAAGAAVQ